MALDVSLFGVIYKLSHTYWLLDGVMIFFAQYSGYFLILGALALLFVLRKDWKRQFYCLAVTGLSLLLSYGVITQALRFFFYRERPFLALSLEPLFEKASSSFPSGHAAFFFALSVAILFFHKKLGLWFLATSVLMGFARVYAGVHYPLDIAGGAAIGMASALFAVYVLQPKKFGERIRKLSFID
jgi:undecaprenyl-diphosphatase